MREEKFTQGEWNIADCRETPYAGYDYLIVDADRLAIAYIENCSQEEQEANAALIAAAPGMYDCICDALTDLEMTDGMRNHFEAVLMKARGEVV